MLPHADRAIVHPDKLLRYLLDPTNPRSRGKPAVFFALGYAREGWERLRGDLLLHGRTHPVAKVELRGEDAMYTVEGDIQGPTGRTHLRTVWQVDAGTVIPRLVSAYALSPKGRSGE